MWCKARFEATTDFARSADCDALIICVPTPLNQSREPDLSFVTATLDQITPNVRKGQLLALESTTWPGTTKEVLLPYVEQAERNAIADRYSTSFLGSNSVTPPELHGDRTSAWAQYTVRVANRDAVQKALSKAGIATAVHYPMALSNQPAVAQPSDVPESDRAAAEVLSLPITGTLAPEAQNHIITTLLQVASATASPKT